MLTNSRIIGGRSELIARTVDQDRLQDCAALVESKAVAGVAEDIAATTSVANSSRTAANLSFRFRPIIDVEVLGVPVDEPLPAQGFRGGSTPAQPASDQP